jgi:hypothetical protein
MSFDRTSSAKTRPGSVYLPRYKGNTLNDFCGNRCGKAPSGNVQKTPESPSLRGTVGIASRLNYLYFLMVSNQISTPEFLISSNLGGLRLQSNLHRFGAFCSVRVTGRGICISANGSLLARDFSATPIVTPSVDSLQSQGYSDFDQRHSRQAEVLP